MSSRLRLYQYEHSPFCIALELALRDSGISYEVENLPICDPTRVIELTEGKYYQVPLLQDLLKHRLIYDQSPAGDDIARFLAAEAPLLNLFPEEVEGLQRILLSYIENDCEAVGFKICDALRDQWLKTDLDRGRHRRHKERKFGPGCLEEWTRQLDVFTGEFYRLLQPFEQILARQPFLTGAHPVYADYALCGVIGMFLYPGTTSLPGEALMLEAWYTKMRAGNFRGPLDAVQLAALDQFNERAGQYGTGHILANVADVEEVVAELKLRPGSRALDVATGHGHTALCLAARGFNVTAADLSSAMLRQTAQLATERGLIVELQEHAAEKLPYPDGTFSLVTCRVAAHHFSSPATFVREAARVLKTYGYLVIIDPSVPDDHVEAAEWMNTVEKLRDPSHVRLHTPETWRKWCTEAGLTVTRATTEAFKQPDVNWYFNVANTPPENRRQVLEMIAKAPASVRELFKLGQEDGKIVWYWRRLTLVAGKI